MRHHLSNFFLMLPLLWLAAGIVWFPQGSKPMVAIVLVSVIGYLVLSGFSEIKRNWSNNYWLWGILISTIFIGASYATYGASTQELRALIISLIYLSILPKRFVSLSVAQYLLLLAAVVSFGLSLWFGFIAPTDRMQWPSNPIPLAAHQGLISLLAIGLLLLSFKGKKPIVLGVSVALAGFSILPTQSRGVILGVLAIYLLVGVVLLIQKKISFRYAFLALVLVIGSGFLAKDALMARASDTFKEIEHIKNGNMNSSIGVRFQMYQAGLELFQQKPILGHGQFTVEYAKKNAPGYTNAAYSYMKGHLHNNFIDKMAKSGLIGLTIFLFFMLYPMYLSTFKYKEYFWLLFLPSAHYILFSLTDSPFRNGDTAVVYLIVIGLIINCAQFDMEEKEQ
ncbi:O-antigen ligase family protein [Vibrio kyushuensis]|uniref:O-antigen ligase family protein n=1 Tax=Vibrio kyushuensis TaxID=2910249 RepID=UPI003D119B0E